MKRHFAIGLLFLLLSNNSAIGQQNDIIINYRGDTIQCRIIKVENDLVYYKKKGQSPTTQTYLTLKEINQLLIDKESVFYVAITLDTETLNKQYEQKNVSLDSLTQRFEIWQKNYFSNEQQRTDFKLGYKDRIIIASGDTIQCRISIINEVKIHFTANEKNQPKDLVIPINGVKEFSIDNYSDPFILLPKNFINKGNNYINLNPSSDKITTEEDLVSYEPKKGQWFFSINPIVAFHEYSFSAEYFYKTRTSVSFEVGYINKLKTYYTNTFVTLPVLLYNGGVFRTTFFKYKHSERENRLKYHGHSVIFKYLTTNNAIIDEGKYAGTCETIATYQAENAQLLGYQYIGGTKIFAKSFVVDIFAGFGFSFLLRQIHVYGSGPACGYGHDNKSSDENSFLAFPTISGGLRLGFITRSKEKEPR